MPLTPPGDGYQHLSEVSGANDAKFKRDPKPAETVAVEGKFLHFDGRAYPVGYVGEHTTDQWDEDYLINSTVDGGDQWAALRTLLDTRRGVVLVWQDHLGNVVYVKLLAATRSLMLPSPFARVRFTLMRVDPP